MPGTVSKVRLSVYMAAVCRKFQNQLQKVGACQEQFKLARINQGSVSKWLQECQTGGKSQQIMENSRNSLEKLGAAWVFGARDQPSLKQGRNSFFVTASKSSN